MKDLATGGFSHAQIYDALHGSSGTRQVKFRYDLIRDGVTIGQLPVIDASIRFQKHDSIKRTARFSLGEDTRINWLEDQIKPYMLVRMPDKETIKIQYDRTWGDLAAYGTWENLAAQFATWKDVASYTVTDIKREEQWAEFPLGVFIPSSPSRHFSDGTTYEVEAYDRSVILREDCITDRLYFPAGTSYYNALESILVGAGIDEAMITQTSAVFATDREFETGESKLDILNQLLVEISYDSVYVNEEGIFVLHPYVEPSENHISIWYENDELSVIGLEADTEMDLYRVPNVFVAIVSNPDYTKDNTNFEFFRSEYINDNPVSVLSTVRRGRKIVSILNPENIASQTDLDHYVRRIAFESSQVYEQVSFSSALMPIHGNGEVLGIKHPDINGAYEEIGWEMELSASGEMNHSIRRLMVL